MLEYSTFVWDGDEQVPALVHYKWIGGDKFEIADITCAVKFDLNQLTRIEIEMASRLAFSGDDYRETD